MTVWRAYIDKKLREENGVIVGGDHSRVIDKQGKDSPGAEIEEMLEDDERIAQIVIIIPDEPELHLREGVTAVDG